MKLNLYIENFKCFEIGNIELSNLTVLAGANSVGKSTTIQALLLLKAAEDELMKKEKIVALNNLFSLNLGTTKDVLYRNANKDEIRIVVKDDVNYPNIIEKPYIVLSMNIQKNPIFLNIEFHSQQNEISADVYTKENSKWKFFYYLNAERIGPRLNYDIGKSETFIGYNGEFSIFVLDNIKDEEIDREDIRLFDKYDLKTYSYQTELWINYITSVKNSINTEIIKDKIALISYDKSIPTNVGFGISYVLPIILNGLLAEKGSMFIVENPEAHLHPSGQSRIGQFLARVAASGVQVVVETHSEHVINGMRIAAIDPNHPFKKDDLCINSFTKNKQGKVEVTKIELDERGELTSWPDGFFDQAEIDYKEILKLRKK